MQKFDRIYGLDVRESLRMRFGCDLVFRFANDASAFALGESLCGATAENVRFLSLTLGTGVGSGLVEEHRLVESGDRVPANGWV